MKEELDRRRDFAQLVVTKGQKLFLREKMKISRAAQQQKKNVEEKFYSSGRREASESKAQHSIHI